MKRRCPNHWTKGTKKPFFIYLGSENRSGSFCFYTQFKISFVFMLAISDVNSAGRPPFLRVPSPTQWHTNHAPSLSPIIKPPDPFIFLSSPRKTPLFRIQKKRKKRGEAPVWSGEGLCYSKKKSTLRFDGNWSWLRKAQLMKSLSR